MKGNEGDPASSGLADHIIPVEVQELLWMDEILHHFDTMGSQYLLVFIGESSETSVS